MKKAIAAIHGKPAILRFFAFVGITFWLIPETKNVTLEHIERKLMADRPKC